MRSLGVGLILGAVCFSHGCGRSERVDDDDGGDAGESTGGTGNRGGTAGNATGGLGGSGACDALHCRSGNITLGPCPGSDFTSCDRAVAGVDCVTQGSCPTITAGGVGGVAGGTGGVSGAGGAYGGAAGVDGDCLWCRNGGFGIGPCPAEPFTPCDPATSGVDCVPTGACPGTGGEGGGP